MNGEAGIAQNDIAAKGLYARIENQLGLRLFREYLIPEETNTIWYAFGGMLGIAIALQFLSGFFLLVKYVPDAAIAFGVIQSLLGSPIWRTILSFHYWNAFLIFGLLMIHQTRVFITGGYRGRKRGLWLVGVSLAVLLFASFLTGEALHWDEAGFAVPWHISEFLQATSLAEVFHYTFSDLLSIPSATVKLVQLYAAHVAVLPILMVPVIMLHIYLVKEKGISLPFWKKPSGRRVPFLKQIKLWFRWSLFIFGALLIISAFAPRGAGVAPQLLPASPLYGAHGGPGKLGAKPSFPISWTHGMNVFVEEHLGVTPDIWGTVFGMIFMLGALVAIPFVDRNEHEPQSPAEAFDLRRRGWAFAFMALFWLVFLIGVIQNAVAAAG